MFRRVGTAAVTLVVAAALSLAGLSPATAAPPADQSNSTSYWQTPGTGEVCAKVESPGGTTWTLPAPPAGSVWTKVVIKAGSTGQSVDAENNAYYSNATYKYPADAPGTTWVPVGDLQSTTFSHPSGKDISHVIYCSAPKPPVAVTGGAAATNQTCQADALVGGVITVTLTTGVSYTVTGPSGAVPFDPATGQTAPLPPGAYTVTVAADAGYTLSGPSSIPLTIAPYGEPCGQQQPTPVSGAASATDQQCVADALVGGVITVTVKDGVTYTITGPSGAVPFDATTGQTAPLAPGSYTVTVSANAGYALTGASSIPLTIAAYGDDCGTKEPVRVTPSATVVDQTCLAGVLLIDGKITVGSEAGVTYTITGPGGAVAIDPVTRSTGPLAPGTYSVKPTAQAGYELTSNAAIVLTVKKFDGTCDLTTFATVTPAATATSLTCFANGTITLSDDQFGLGATAWTVNGAPTAAATITVTSPGTYAVHVEPTAGFTLEQGSQSDWTFTFARPASCELTTLALTGDDGSPWYAALAAGLGLLGIAMIRAGRSGRARA